MGRDNDDPKKDNDGEDWTYDGDRSRFRMTVERIESAMLEIGGENLVLHWQGQRSSEKIAQAICELAPYAVY